MITGPLSSRAQELTAQGATFVTATVVRVEHPTSVAPGNVALVHEDGSIEGFVGGVCAQNSVRLYSLKAIERGEPLLLRILPDGPGVAAVKSAANVDPGHEVAHDEGSVTVQNPCLSGGAIEVFLEPFLPPPRMIVAGDTPIAAALLRLGPELGLDAVDSRGGDSGAVVPSADDLALVVAAHGRDELTILRAALEADVPYVGLVASRRRGAGVLEELRKGGVAEELLGRIDTPAGLDIGARTPAEVALSILASIVEVRRRSSTAPRSWAAAPPTAVDPICGMTVVVSADAPSVMHDGDTHYFCGEGCLRAFERQHASA
ncbi:MAG TPA: XdhC family protein [Solirubrobacteraceae bacterium]|nr:XdhC family protein [Solirubrobacteraceae bacterium]